MEFLLNAFSVMQMGSDSEGCQARPAFQGLVYTSTTYILLAAILHRIDDLCNDYFATITSQVDAAEEQYIVSASTARTLVHLIRHYKDFNAERIRPDETHIQNLCLISENTENSNPHPDLT